MPWRRRRLGNNADKAEYLPISAAHYRSVPENVALIMTKLYCNQIKVLKTTTSIIIKILIVQSKILFVNKNSTGDTFAVTWTNKCKSLEFVLSYTSR